MIGQIFGVNKIHECLDLPIDTRAEPVTFVFLAAVLEGLYWSGRTETRRWQVMGEGQTYGGSHLGSESAVRFLVTKRDDVVIFRGNATSLVEDTFRIQRANGGHLSQNIGVG
ncbi:hypothetical protein RRF57_010606 [Xylaria bambusicola]|uniref:Uncharacterized protein n=1 Tax=Xylaria bambusicola TaxID=326684 RepID=A0AAN7V3S6_9PEZI